MPHGRDIGNAVDDVVWLRHIEANKIRTMDFSETIAALALNGLGSHPEGVTAGCDE